MLSLEQFLDVAPDFKKAGNAFVQGMLDEAAVEISTTAWGNYQNAAHRLLTSRKLALSPFGKNARMVSVEGGTVYDSEYKRLLKIVAPSKRPFT